MTKTSKRDDERKRLLLESFGGNVDGWEYVGTDDAGEGVTQSLNPPKCPCGHVIRYICRWEHKDGRKNHTGNVCVEAVPALNDTFGEAISQDIKKIQSDKRKKAAAEKLAAAREEARKAYSEIDKYFKLTKESVAEKDGWLPREEYYRVNRWKKYRSEIFTAMTLKTAKGVENRVASVIQSMKMFRY